MLASVQRPYIELEAFEIYALSPESYHDDLLFYIHAYETGEKSMWIEMVEQAHLGFDTDRHLILANGQDLVHALLGYPGE